MTTTLVNAGDGLQTVTGLTASENTDALAIKKGTIMAVAAADGGGSGFNAGTITIQVSFDGTTWFTAKDAQGSAVTFTVNGYAEICTAAKWIRASADSNISDVDIAFSMGG